MSKPQGLLRPLGLALVLALGFAVVFAVAAAWARSIWESLHGAGASERVVVRTEHQANGRVTQVTEVNADSGGESLVVREDGTPLIQRWTNDGYRNAAIRTLNLRALEGREVPGHKEKEVESWLDGASLGMPGRSRFWLADWLMFPLSSGQRVRRFAEGRTPCNLWYFLDDGARDGRGYFVGYDSRSKQCVGFIGRDGLRPDLPPVEKWFPIDGDKLVNGAVFSRLPPRGDEYGEVPVNVGEFPFPMWKVDMICGAQLLEVNLRTGSVRTLLESADLMSAGILETATKSAPAGEAPTSSRRREKLAVRTSDRVLLFDAARKQYAAYVIPREFRGRTITFYELNAGTALLAANRLLPDWRNRQELLWTDASGKVLRRAEVTLGKSDPHHRGVELRNTSLVFPVPVVLAFLATVLVPLEDLDIGVVPNYSTALTHSLAAGWLPMLLVSLLAVVLAAYCYRRHRRYYQRASGVWFLFVLLTGVAGLVAYLFHRRWPVLEKCPACGRDVPRDRETCANCGAAFPLPEPKGCEVFA